MCVCVTVCVCVCVCVGGCLVTAVLWVVTSLVPHTLPSPSPPLLSYAQREWMAAMVEAHSKDDAIWYYASLLLAQFEGAEEWSHTTPLPLHMSYTTW